MSSDPWRAVLVTHREAVDRLPASIRADFLPPNPWAALGVSMVDVEKALTIPRPMFAAGGYVKGLGA